MVHPKQPSDGPRSLLSVRGLEHGSLAALLAYPTLIEPNLGLGYQSRLWSADYVVLVLLLMACASVIWRIR